MRREMKLLFSTFTILTLLLLVFGTASYGTNPDPDHLDMPKINSVVLGEWNSIDESMNAVYQAMYSLMKQSHEIKKDRLQDVKDAHIKKQRAGSEAIDAKKREIEGKIRSAKSEFWASVSISMASCVAVVDDATRTGASVENLYRAPNKQEFQRFTENSARLKEKLQQLNMEVNRLRDMLYSGAIDSVQKDDLEKLEKQVYDSLQHVSKTKNYNVELVNNRRSDTGSTQHKGQNSSRGSNNGRGSSFE